VYEIAVGIQIGKIEKKVDVKCFVKMNVTTRKTNTA